MQVSWHQFLWLGFVLLFVSCADDPIVEEEVEKMCGVDYYLNDDFMTTKTTVQFGSNTNVDGTEMNLMMDIYTPDGSALTDKPVIIWAFGGAFVSGNRQNMEEFAQFFATKGYVSATIDYRILSIAGGIPDSLGGLDIAIKASTDMKAAVRYLRHDAINDNAYGINPDQIYVGGVSAGAITALNVGVLDSDEVKEDHIQQIIDDNGGIEGNSNNIDVSSEVAGIINFSGAVYRLDWIDANDPPIFSFHGTSDGTVSYYYDFAKVQGFPIIKLYGSNPIHERANSVGLKNLLISVAGGDHSDIYTSSTFETERNMMFDQLTSFMIAEVCQ